MRVKRARVHSAKPERNAALEDVLVENPDDIGTRAIFADWLQSVGDPWGDLIALELAGKRELAARLLNRHPKLHGGLPRSHVTWSQGFIEAVHVPVDDPHAMRRLAQLRTTLLVRRVRIEHDQPRMALAIERLRVLRDLDIQVTRQLTDLASRTVERLRLLGNLWTVVPAMFDQRALPKLRELESWATLSFTHVRDLLDTPLVARLDCLALSIDPPAAMYVLRRADDLARIPRLMFRNDQNQIQLDAVFAKQMRAYRSKIRTILG